MSKEEEIDYEDYFLTKYNSEISDLFLEIKKISESFCLDLFTTTDQNRNGSFQLSKFLFDKIILEDEINEENENTNEIIEYDEI